MFDDIRPYNDSEVSQVVTQLINDKEFIDAIALLSVPKLSQFLPSLTSMLIKLSLKRKAKNFNSIEAIQSHVAKYLHKIVKRTTDGFTHHGLEQLDLSKPCLFVSNHRDIVLDVALINYALFQVESPTVEAAVGDNLLSKKWVADLMRINKSFIVKRSEATKRAMLTASKQLSAYIFHSLSEKQEHIWIAQKEGRAKDGIDKTNPALISMLLLNKSKTLSIEEYLTQINIVPVAISYEFDPCDQDKAIELAQKSSTGSYDKDEHEDLQSITRGIVGHKGRVNVSFCQPIQGNFEDSKAIATAIDEEIINQYKLFPSNVDAYNQLNNDQKILNEENSNASIATRLTDLTTEQQQWLLAMYANPVAAKKSLAN